MTVDISVEMVLNDVRQTENGYSLEFISLESDEQSHILVHPEWYEKDDDSLDLRNACQMIGVDVYAVENLMFRDVIEHIIEVTLDNGEKTYIRESNRNLLQKIYAVRFLQSAIGRKFKITYGDRATTFRPIFSDNSFTKKLTLADVQIFGCNPIDWLQLSFIDQETGFTAYYIFSDSWDDADEDCLGMKSTMKLLGLNVPTIVETFVNDVDVDVHPETLEEHRFNMGLAALKTKEGCDFDVEVFRNYIEAIKPVI
ncbi:hypothetical protein ACWATR_38290 [Nostoc sp. UIC 10890]